MTIEYVYDCIKDREGLESFSISKFDSENIHIDLIDEKFETYSSVIWQFDKLITPQGIDFRNVMFENLFSRILDKELVALNRKYSIGFVFNTFIKEFDSHSQEINSKKDLLVYLNKISQNLIYHKEEVFPKLLDMDFLAEYVGELKEELVVGGDFPVRLFKKMAILKWGNQEQKYDDQKKETQNLIEKYALKKPEKYRPSFKDNFERLIHHLENQANPF